MLQTNDIGVLFSVFRASYGNQWTMGPDDIPVWQQKLSGHSPAAVMAAAYKAIDQYPDHPPTPGQLKIVLQSQKPKPSTYLPAPTRSISGVHANTVMLKVTLENFGIDRIQLRKVRDLKNALVEEHGHQKSTKEFIADLYKQLTALAKGHDKNARANEREEARQQYCRRQGMACR